MCFDADRKNPVIIVMADMYHFGHMQDSILNALHIFTHSIFLTSLWGHSTLIILILKIRKWKHIV